MHYILLLSSSSFIIMLNGLREGKKNHCYDTEHELGQLQCVIKHPASDG